LLRGRRCGHHAGIPSPEQTHTSGGASADGTKR
jgi:hypothetical protein